MNAAALLEQVTEELYARHTTDTEAAGLARREYEERRGKVHQDDELWEAWSAAFVEWYVVERAGDGEVPPAVRTYRELVASDDSRAAIVILSGLYLFARERKVLGGKAVGPASDIAAQ